MGEADAALGFFTPDETAPIPQVLVEFKDIKSALDAPQKRKGNSRSPVKQGLDYLYASRKGMFGYEPDLERLHSPNSIFCERGQGQNEASLAANKLTLLYLSANYNYASSWGEGVVNDEHTPSAKRDPERSIGLYTLGRIFEQSITELEILEAEEEGRKSVNKESKRKRDGVYYTPEWVVERIVDETVGRLRISELPDSDFAKSRTAISVIPGQFGHG